MSLPLNFSNSFPGPIYSLSENSVLSQSQISSNLNKASNPISQIPEATNSQTNELSAKDDDLSEIFQTIKSEFPSLPPLPEQSSAQEIQYRLSNDEINIPLPQLELPSINTSIASINSIAMQNLSSTITEPKKRKVQSSDEERSIDNIQCKKRRKKCRTYDIQFLTDKIKMTLKTSFLPKSLLGSSLSCICDNFSTQNQNKDYIDCVNIIFEELLSVRWKGRFISALSLYYKPNGHRVEFLKKNIISLLLPEKAKILTEILEDHKAGSSAALKQALNKFKWTTYNSKSSLKNLFKVIIQYAKNRMYFGNNSSHLSKIANLFTSMDNNKIQILSSVLKDFSNNELNLLVEYLPNIRAYIDYQITHPFNPYTSTAKKFVENET